MKYINKYQNCNFPLSSDLHFISMYDDILFPFLFYSAQQNEINKGKSVLFSLRLWLKANDDNFIVDDRVDHDYDWFVDKLMMLKIISL